MDVLLKLFEVVFPVFFVVGIGYYLGKKNPKIDTDFITNFAANIGTPGLLKNKGLTDQQIADHFNSQNIKTPTGKNYTRQLVLMTRYKYNKRLRRSAEYRVEVSPITLTYVFIKNRRIIFLCLNLIKIKHIVGKKFGIM